MSLFSYKSGHSVRYRTSLLFYFFNKSITYVFGTGFALWRVENKNKRNMDREISKEVRQKEQRKQFIKAGGGDRYCRCLDWRGDRFYANQLQRKDLVFSTVDKGVIEVSVSASGKVVPAFEEIINHRSTPVSSRFIKGRRFRGCRYSDLETGLAKRRDGYKKQIGRGANETPPIGSTPYPKPQ